MSIAKSYSFSNSEVADPAKVNQNFDDAINAVKASHHSDVDGSPIEPDDIASGWGLVPSKGVIMFNDTVANIPSGYFFCNGANGTPDLREKFVFGVNADGGTYPKGTTGGEKRVTLSISEIPSHNHGGATGGQSADHTHFDAGHNHVAKYKDGISGSGSTRRETNSTGGATDWTEIGYASLGGSSQDHNQGITAQGGGASHENMPPFHCLVFIMKS